MVNVNVELEKDGKVLRQLPGEEPLFSEKNMAVKLCVSVFLRCISTTHTTLVWKDRQDQCGDVWLKHAAPSLVKMKKHKNLITIVKYSGGEMIIWACFAATKDAAGAGNK